MGRGAELFRSLPPSFALALRKKSSFNFFLRHVDIEFVLEFLVSTMAKKKASRGAVASVLARPMPLGKSSPNLETIPRENPDAMDSDTTNRFPPLRG